MVLRYPFSPVSGEGLGISYSSQMQVGDLIPNESVGAANLKIYPNVSNGNLVIKDRIVTLKEESGEIALGFVYNSQAVGGSLWQLTHKRMVGFPTSESDTVVIQESDGHLTGYQSTSQKRLYQAPGLGDGTPYILYHDITNTWEWYHPGTQVTEYYDGDGLLQKRCNAIGCVSTYRYDGSGQLTQIEGSAGYTYQIERAVQNDGTSRVTFFESKGGTTEALQTSIFDGQGCLLTTFTKDQTYSISYTYCSLRCVYDIKQSDGSWLGFQYDDDHSMSPQVINIQNGENNNWLTYLSGSDSVTQLSDGLANLIEFTTDVAGRVTQLVQQRGYDIPDDKTDITQYSYTSAGQIERVVYPDGSQIQYEYDSFFGVITQKSGANSQLIMNHYYPDGNVLIKFSEERLYGVKSLVTYYMHETNWNNTGKLFLRFEISPEGRVTEYRPDAIGHVASKRHYLNGLFDTRHLNPVVPTSLIELMEWVNQQDPQKVSLTEYAYDDRDQLSEIKRYVRVDGQGNGIIDEGMGHEIYSRDRYGNLLSKEILQVGSSGSVAVMSVTNQSFDAVSRMTSHTDPMLGITSYSYLDQTMQIQTTYANGRVLLKSYDPRGLTTSTLETIQNEGGVETRLKRYTRDALGRAVEAIGADGGIVYHFFDRQNRCGMGVSPTGIVTQKVFSRKNRYESKTVYAEAINPEDLYIINPPPPGVYPLPFTLLGLLAKPGYEGNPLNRTTYQFYDASNRLIVTVDGMNAMTQYSYDSLNRKTTEVSYGGFINQDQLNILLQGQILNIAPDFRFDRCHRWFYDDDNKKRGEQDAAGYVTQYKRDQGGRIIEKIRYATPVGIDLSQRDFSQIIPNEAPERDAKTYYFRDARGQCIGEVDAGGYLTTYDYLANGLLSQKTRYANAVDPAWFANPGAMPILPPLSTEDQTTHYQYDLNNRVIQTDLPLSQQKRCVYDVMGNVLLTGYQDGTNPQSLLSDDARSTQAQYDGFDQIVREANPYVSALLSEAENDPSKVAMIWETQSQHYDYDATGLKCATTLAPREDEEGNSVNDIIYFYYDAERRPIIQINPTGSVIEKCYNSFGEVILSRAYANRLSDQTLSTLTGGLLSDVLRTTFNALQDNSKDAITNYQYNNQGLVSQITDSEGNVTVKGYTAYKELEIENLPINGSLPSLEIEHTYDVRGLEIKTTKRVNDGVTASITTQNSYMNLYGKKTETIDGNQGRWQTVYNRLGQVIEKIDALGRTKHRYTRDAFNRVLTDTDGEGEITRYRYEQTTRKKEIVYPLLGSKKKLVQNVFGEIIESTDSLGAKESWRHAPDGQESSYTDQRGSNQTKSYDLNGRKIAETNSLNIKTTFSYDGAGNLIKKVDDLSGLKYTTTITPDAFGNPEITIDPRQVITQKTFDRKNQEIMCVIDPIGLNLMTQKTYNGQGKPISLIQGDKANENQYEEAYEVDGFNREIGKTIAPKTIKIQTQKRYDSNNNLIAEIDGNGNAKCYFYDVLNQRCYTVDAEGGIYQRTYDVMGRVLSERLYAKKIDPGLLNKGSTLSDIENIVQISSEDSLTFYYYDENGNERFKVNSGGIVEEKRYNLNGKEVIHISYDKAIDANKLAQYTTPELMMLMGLNRSASDRYTYKIYDAKGNVVYSIDAEGYLTENIYNALNKPIVQTRYAVALKDAGYIATLPIEKIADQIQSDVKKDRTKYNVYDALDRLSFSVAPEGNVIKHDYDENGNEIEKSCFFEKIVVPQNYVELVVLLNTLMPAAKKDRITQRSFDAANRKVTETDALGNIKKYERDALGNIKTLIDENNDDWCYGYDDANRLVSESTPLVDITIVTSIPTETDSVQLKSTVQNQTIEKTTRYDLNGNKVEVIEGANTSLPRTIAFSYDKRNALSGTVIENVDVDDPSLPASYSALPVFSVMVSTKTVRDAKNRTIVEQKENGAWFFNVYEREGIEGKPCYTINALGGVEKKTYNHFGEVIEETRYAKPINLALKEYLETGIPLEALEREGVIETSEEDRTTVYERDRRGNVILKILPEQFYYFIDPETLKAQSGYECARIKTTYDAFREGVLTEKLWLPGDPHQWAQHIKWFNRNGQKCAESDGLNRIKTYTFNGFNEEIMRWEWDLLPSSVPSLETNYETLLGLNQASMNDRWYQKTYNLAGKILSETRAQGAINTPLGVTIQALKFDANYIPSLQDQRYVGGLTRWYSYNATGQKMSTTYEDGATEYNFYDARGLKIGFAGVQRQSEDDQGNEITVIPLTYYGYDAFGKKVKETRFSEGCTGPIVPGVLPLPTKTNQNDQATYTLFDNRGLVVFRQDGNGHVEGYTSNLNRKVARNFDRLSDWEASHIDETRYEFDLLENKTSVDIYRDNTIIQTNALGYNIFRHLITEGPTTSDWRTYHHYDRTGKNWLSNGENGAYVIKGSNLLGHGTVVVKSKVQDLSILKYDDLAKALQSDKVKKTLELTESVKDRAGRLVARLGPGEFPLVTPGGGSLPPMLAQTALCLKTEGSTTEISWISPFLSSSSVLSCQSKEIEEDYNVVVTLWRLSNPKEQKTFKLTSANYTPLSSRSGQYHFTIEDLSSDIYGYTIQTYLITEGHKTPYSYYEGSFQCDTGLTKDSEAVVPVPMLGGLVKLVGKTGNVASVELYEEGVFIKSLPVSYNAQGEMIADLSDMASGTYTLMPELTDKNKVFTTLPFAIYTQIPSTKPLSREIDVSVNLLTLTTYAEINWVVPNDLLNYAIQVSCDYEGDDGKIYTHQDTINPGTNLGEYTDNNGNVLTCNTVFEQTVAKIVNLSVCLEIGDEKALLTLMEKVDPLSSEKVKENKEQIESGWIKVGELEAAANDPTPVSGVIVTTEFAPRTNILLMGVLEKEGVSLEVIDTSKWPVVSMEMGLLGRIVSSTHPAYQGIIVDVTELEISLYPYHYETLSGTLSVSKGLSIYESDQTTNHQNNDVILTRPIWQYGYDAWNNPVKSINTLGLSTIKTYNIDNKVITVVEPEMTVFNADGSAQKENPQTCYGYNARGFNIGITDANKHTTAYGYDVAGQSIRQIEADGAISYTQIFDPLSRVKKHIDERGKVWTNTYDLNNQLIRQTFPSGSSYTVTYDEKNNRMGYTLPSKTSANSKYDYGYDPFKNIIKSRYPEGQQWTYAYDKNHQLTLSIDPDGCKLEEDRDYWGKVLKSVDYSGDETFYSYDQKGQLIHEASTKWSHGYTGDLKPIYLPKRGGTGYSFMTYPTPIKDRSYGYEGNALVQIEDRGVNELTKYFVDTEGRKVGVLSYSGIENPQPQDRRYSYYSDGSNRIATTFNSMGSFSYGYDAVGNERYVDGKAFGVEKKLWSDYDACNRATVYQGILVNGQILIGGDQGLVMTYKEGFRDTQTEIVHLNGVWTSRTQTLSYNDDGLLSKMTSNVDVTVTWSYDEAGWMNSWSNGTDSLSITCNGNGWQIHSHQVGLNEAMDTVISDFTGQGLPKTETDVYWDGAGPENSYTDQLNYYYLGFGQFLQSDIIGQRTSGAGTSPYAGTHLCYDANGNPQIVLQENDTQNGKHWKRGCLVGKFNTISGEILSKEIWSFPSGITDISEKIAEYYGASFYFYDVNGNPLGSYDSTGLMVISVIPPVTISPMPSAPGNPPKTQKKHGPPPNYAIGINASALTQTYPPVGPESYTTMPGDSFNSIAQNLLGSGQYDALIAFANGWDVNTALPGGMVLEIPQSLSKYNTANTEEPLAKFVSIMMGSITPLLPTKMPIPKQHKNGFWDEFIEVMVVATAMASGYIVGGPVLSAVVSGLVDAAGQEVAVALGAQEHFSLSEASDVGLTVGIGEGISSFGNPILGFEAGALTGGQALTEVVAIGGTTALLDQLAGMATGTQSKFSFRQLINDMVANVTAMGVDSEFPNEEESGLLQGEVNELINVGVGQVINHSSFNMQSISANMLGMPIGSMVGMEIGKGITSGINASVQAYTQYKSDKKSLSASYSKQGMFGASKNGNAQSNASASASTSYGQGNTTETSKVAKDNLSSNDLTYSPVSKISANKSYLASISDLSFSPISIEINADESSSWLSLMPSGVKEVVFAAVDAGGEISKELLSMCEGLSVGTSISARVYEKQLADIKNQLSSKKLSIEESAVLLREEYKMIGDSMENDADSLNIAKNIKLMGTLKYLGPAGLATDAYLTSRSMWRDPSQKNILEEGGGFFGGLLASKAASNLMIKSTMLEGIEVGAEGVGLALAAPEAIFGLVAVTVVGTAGVLVGKKIGQLSDLISYSLEESWSSNKNNLG